MIFVRILLYQWISIHHCPVYGEDQVELVEDVPFSGSINTAEWMYFSTDVSAKESSMSHTNEASSRLKSETTLKLCSLMAVMSILTFTRRRYSGELSRNSCTDRDIYAERSSKLVFL